MGDDDAHDGPAGAGARDAELGEQRRGARPRRRPAEPARHRPRRAERRPRGLPPRRSRPCAARARPSTSATSPRAPTSTSSSASPTRRRCSPARSARSRSARSRSRTAAARLDNRSEALPPETLQDIPVGSIPVGSISANRGDADEAAQVVADGEDGLLHDRRERLQRLAQRRAVRPARRADAAAGSPALPGRAGSRSAPLATLAGAGRRHEDALPRQPAADGGALRRAGDGRMLASLAALAAQARGRGRRSSRSTATAPSARRTPRGTRARARSTPRTTSSRRSTPSSPGSARHLRPPLRRPARLRRRAADDATPRPCDDLERDRLARATCCSRPRNCNANSLYAAAALGYFLSDALRRVHDDAVAGARPYSRTCRRPPRRDRDGHRAPVPALRRAKGGLLNPQSALTTGTTSSPTAAKRWPRARTLAARDQHADQRHVDGSHLGTAFTNKRRPGRRPLRQRALQPLAAAAGRRPTLVSTANLPDVEDAFADRILFTMGCHGGLNVPDTLLGPTPTAFQRDRLLDWTQSYAPGARRGLRREHRLRLRRHRRERPVRAPDVDLRSEDPRPRTIGERWLDSVHEYFGTAGVYGVYDEKALTEATFYGLPFWSLGAAADPARRRRPAHDRPGLRPPGGLAERRADAHGALDDARPLLGGDEPPDARDPLPADPAARRNGRHSTRARRDRRDHQVPPDGRRRRRRPRARDADDRPRGERGRAPVPRVDLPRELGLADAIPRRERRAPARCRDRRAVPPGNVHRTANGALIMQIGLEIAYVASPSDVTPPVVEQVSALHTSTSTIFVRASESAPGGVKRVAALYTGAAAEGPGRSPSSTSTAHRRVDGDRSHPGPVQVIAMAQNANGLVRTARTRASTSSRWTTDRPGDPARVAGAGRGLPPEPALARDVRVSDGGVVASCVGAPLTAGGLLDTSRSVRTRSRSRRQISARTMSSRRSTTRCLRLRGLLRADRQLARGERRRGGSRVPGQVAAQDVNGAPSEPSLRSPRSRRRARELHRRRAGPHRGNGGHDVGAQVRHRVRAVPLQLEDGEGRRRLSQARHRARRRHAPERRLPAALDHPALGSPARQLVAARQLQLPEHARDVALDRLDGEVEARGDLLVAVAARDQPQHLALAGGQLVELGVATGSPEPNASSTKPARRGENTASPAATRSIASTSSSPEIVFVT